MRRVLSLMLIAASSNASCTSPQLGETRGAVNEPDRVTQRPVASTAPLVAPQTELLYADTPRTTVQGNAFVAPKGWKIAVRGAAVVLEPPEAGSQIALVDVP